ncbi:MAG: protein kinase [Deltaproteobacteria bacterium]|nr:protein kinase [Deltaproteobacteria bacterium]
MTTREDIELYVMGQYDGDVAALERAIAEDPALAQILADEARLDEQLRNAAARATFCPACDDLVRATRCDACGAAVKPGGYTVERVLVSNAHGRMYVAHDADGRRVALKELAFVQAPGADALAKFEREAKFLRALEHPAIPRFLASFEEGRGVHTRYYLAQELVEGTALDRLDEHWYSEVEIRELARQVLGVLVYLQSLSPMVIHRDIKPANLVRRDDRSIALVDFGAAHVHGSTAGVTTVGTFGYMPIEQLAGLVDATTDIYALGMTLMHLMTRQEPWRLVQAKAEVNASPELRAFLAKLTANDPRERFPDAKAALAALDAPAAIGPVAAPSKKRRPALIAAAAGVAFAAAGGSIFALAHHAHHDAPPASPIGTVRVQFVGADTAKLRIDGHQVATVASNQEIPVAAGSHQFRLAGPGGGECEVTLDVQGGKTSTIECAFREAPFEMQMQPWTWKWDWPWNGPHHERRFGERLHTHKRVSWKLDHVKLHDFALLAANTCDFSVVVPDGVDVPVSVNIRDAQCDDAFTAILEAQGLGYSFDGSSQLVRIAPLKDLDDVTPWTNDLPGGKELDLDVKDAPLHDVLALIVKSGGAGVNLVVAQGIDGKVTIRLAAVPWNQALGAVLAAQGLWYRYYPESNLIRVAPAHDFDGR